MILLLEDNKQQKIEVLVDSFKENLIQGKIISSSLNNEFKKIILEYETMVN